MTAFGWTALALWPLVAIVLFATLRIQVALCVTLLAGYLLLPERLVYDLPLLPALDKHSIPAITATILVLIILARRNAPQNALPGWLPRHPIALICLTFLVVGSFGTAITNEDSFTIGFRQFPALRTYDAFAIFLGFATTLLPFILARKVLSSTEGQKILLISTVIAAVAYAFLALFEVRMSPQLHRMIYGFHAHNFGHNIRGGGFRPVVFLQHGLMLGIFMTSAALAAFGLARLASDKYRKVFFSFAALWIVFTILLSKVLGATMILVILMPAVLFLPRRFQLLMIATVSTMVILFPIVRAADLIPTKQVIALAATVSPDRAGSFQFRLDNEDLLLDRARSRALFGWGGYDRNRVLNAAGYDISVTDGYWIILFGSNGWFGYLGIFGLLTGGAVVAAFQRTRKLDPYSIVLSFALVANLIDLIPNAGISPLTWMMAGALFGRLEITDETELTTLPNRAKPVWRRNFASPQQNAHTFDNNEQSNAVRYRRKF